MYTEHILFIEETQPAAQAKQHVVLPPPSVEPLHDVFADAMLEESAALKRRTPVDWVVSLAVHVALLAVLLILPLYFTNGLDVQKFNLIFLATPPVPAAPPAPMAAAAAPRTVRNVPARVYTPGKLTAPSFIPRVVAAATPGESSVPDVVGVPGGVLGGIPGGQVGGVIGGVLGGALVSAPPPAVPLVPEGPKKPVRVGGDVKPPRLLFSPDPVYPVLAKQSHISGVVVIEAIIDERGNVTEMKAVSGHPLLIPAALSAVAKRKYEPTILDGDPTPIDLRVEITFKAV